ncbi:hypothetical protein OG21DRAFT_1145279 [Imleria badia]|nr:hypothetical protein OG21DRAFT_1145279 [Imleria badia]
MSAYLLVFLVTACNYVLTTPTGAHYTRRPLHPICARRRELWAWHFVLRYAQGQGIASVSRAIWGFGRQVFTDTGQCTVSFQAPDEQVYSPSQNSGWILHKPSAVRKLTVDERALVLAMAINIDYDFFSRHSGYPSPLFDHFPHYISHRGFGFWWSSGE